jgi:translation elongation factor EF-1alpha
MEWSNGRETDMTEQKIGTVTHYYHNLHVAGVSMTDGDLHKGDRIHIVGHTSDFEQKVRSIEIDHESVDVARKGDRIGIAVIDHAREHDAVYKVN